MASPSALGHANKRMSLGEKLRQVTWGLALTIGAVAAVGFTMLYSAAGGDWDPWASRQMTRFALGFAIMVAVATIDIRVWMKVAYPFYAVSVVLLLAVEVMGEIGMGAQRWLDLGFVQIQPAELAKISIVLVVARYFHGLSHENIGNPLYLLWPIVLTLVPAFLIFKQPKLGTTLVVLATTGIVFFMAGVRIWKFLVVGLAGAGAVPIAWSLLRDYQKNRVLTFLNPESDPLGAGYHIIQSKIALGSGGMWGKGLLGGTQSHLQFLPEKQTDFIFTMLSEEFGFVGGLVLIGLYTVIVLYGLGIAYRARSQFGRLVAIGILSGIYLNALINMAMVMGLVPVVGEPLPLVSYGGTSMLTLLFGFGILIGVYVHRDVTVPRRGGEA
ncbi:MAG: rod shape-determining protein RodA [Azospirillum sp.]|jgi:rod shape determining protein RodA|nr:rod shape-determining protein RodA [Azospirillum sp.]